jgi:hypothetical protein
MTATGVTDFEARRGLILLPIKCSCSAHAYNRGSSPSPIPDLPPGTKLPLPTASQSTVAPELEGGLAPAPKGGLNGAGGPSLQSWSACPSPATYAF